MRTQDPQRNLHFVQKPPKATYRARCPFLSAMERTVSGILHWESPVPGKYLGSQHGNGFSPKGLAFAPIGGTAAGRGCSSKGSTSPIPALVPVCTGLVRKPGTWGARASDMSRRWDDPVVITPDVQKEKSFVPIGNENLPKEPEIRLGWISS